MFYEKLENSPNPCLTFHTKKCFNIMSKNYLQLKGWFKKQIKVKLLNYAVPPTSDRPLLQIFLSFFLDTSNLFSKI